mmetsp:Transcript_15745/g.23635  ORF Transcript_15745/g.23635 Transcript_15745/m.23635 type:complete len:304 (+) Transcript_15745:198-1109(+)
MMNIPKLHKDPNGPSPFILLELPESKTSAKIYTFGAHVVSFEVDEDEKLWMSSLSVLDGSGPVRGGVPIAFPQFADEGPLTQMHGFARESTWDVIEGSSSNVTLGLKDSDETRAKWPHSFSLLYEIKLLPKGIVLHLKVRNTDEKSFTFSGCLHTYFKFDDALGVALHGFRKTAFADKADRRKEKVQDGPIEVKKEADKSARDAGVKHGFVDRIHYNSPNNFQFIECNSGKVLYNICQSDSWTDTTVYNPYLGDKQGPTFPDFDDDGYLYTICCEPTLSERNAITLDPGSEWEGKQEILVPEN